MELSPELGDATALALRSAAARRPDDRPLSTAAVFAILPEIDHHAEWDRLWLEAGDPQALRLAEAPDGDDPDGGDIAPARWQGVPLTRDLADALVLLQTLRRTYDLPAGTAGLTALALVGDPASGAARRLTWTGMSHGALLDLIQSEILGSTLEGLPALLQRHRHERRAAPSVPASPPPRLPATPRSSPPVRTRTRLRRAGWVACSVLALLAVVVALRTSPSFHSVPPGVDPPFTRPVLADHLVTTADVQSALGVKTVELADRLPELTLFSSTSPMAADLRANALTAGWQREWASADQARYVEVRVLDMTKPIFLKTYRASCQPTTPVALPPATAAVRSGYVVKQAGQADFCIVAEKGTLSVFTVVSMRGPDAAALVSAAAQRLADRGWALAGDYRFTPTIRPPTPHYARDSINRWLILAALLLPLVLAGPLVLADRSTWRRLRRPLRWRTPQDPFVVTVDRAAALALSEATALAVLKIAIYVWLLRLSEALPIGIFATAGLLLAAFGVISVAESRILHGRRGRYTPRPFRGSGRLLAIGGLFLTAAAVAAAFLVADASLSLASLGFNPAGSDYIAGRLGIVGVIFSLFVLAFAVLPLMLVRRVAMRRLRQEAQALPGRHILLLRSFVDDRRRVRARRMDRASVIDRLCLRRWERFEEVVAAALTTIGPVIALSRPGERLPPALGARRQQFAMDAWQDGVRRLIAGSALVCMVVGRTQSLVIEMGEVKRLGALSRTLFLLPPCNRREQRLRLALLARELGIPWSRVQAAIRDRDALLVVQNADPDRALIFTSRAPDDVSYEAAINAAALLLGQQVEASVVIQELVAGLRQRSAGARPEPAGSPAPPAVHVYPPGQAPSYKPLYRRWSVLPWLLGAGLSLLISVYGLVIGVNVDDHPGVGTGDLTATSLAENDVTDGLFGAVDGRLIVRLEPDNKNDKKISVVATSKVYLDDLIVHGTTAFGDTPIDGTVTALSLTTHQPLWTVPVAPGVKGLALFGDTVVTTVPARHEIVALSVRDGHQVAEETLSGTPWGVAASGGSLVVPIVDRAQLVYLTGADLTPVRTVATVSGPQRVLSQGAMLWVLAPTLDRVVRLKADAAGGDQGQLLMSNPAGLVAANADWFAVQGNQRITLVSSTGKVTRLALPFNAISSLCVTRSGHVFVGLHGQVAQLG